jgi:3-hydroxyacyl-[acyl-carrier-protein] dehydratase
MGKVEIGLEEIEKLLPHRPPFLFVDRVLEIDDGKRILAERALRADEPHFAGHFPGEPIMPGVLITEALAQTAGLLLALSETFRGSGGFGRMFHLARADMKWQEPVAPGCVLLLEAKHVKTLGRLQAFRVKAFTDRADVAVGSLTLAEVQRESQ